MQQAPYEERNRKPKSIRKIQKLAANNGLTFEFAEVLANRNWNWDDDNFCWVPIEQKDDIPEAAIAVLEENLKWPRDRVISKQEIVARAQEFVAAGIGPHVERFLAAAPAQNHWALSPLVTVAALRGLNDERIAHCNLPESMDFKEACSHAAEKCGMYARAYGDLAYAAFDSLTVSMATPPAPSDTKWLIDACKAIKTLPPKSGLKELVQATTSIKGNKAWRSRVLIALGIVGVLGTKEYDAQRDFWPDKCKLSSHFYSNDWPFPMNFWGDSGYLVGPHILLDHLSND